MSDSQLTSSEIDRIITSYERQANRLFRVIIMLAISDAIFILLYFMCPQNVDINLAQDKTISSQQHVKG